MAPETAVDRASGSIAGGAASVAARFGPGSRSLLVLSPASGDRQAARLALDLARRIGTERSRTLLLNLDGSKRELDRLVGAVARPGLTAVFRGAARTVDVAVRKDGEPFYYFPAGADAAPAEALLASEAMAHLLRRARAGGATALLFVPEDALPHGDAVPDMDATLLVGSAQRGRAPAGIPLLGRVPSSAQGPPDETRSNRARSPAGPGREVPDPWEEETALLAPPAASGLAAVASATPGLRRVHSRWRQVAALCALALALGFLIAWVGAHDLWQEWLQWSTEVKGEAAR